VYRNVYYNSRDGNVHLFTWNDSGQRIVKKAPYRPYFYIETALDRADALSIFNTRLKKKEFANSFERNKAAQDGAIKRLYHNIQVEQQFLIDAYHEEYDKPDFAKHPIKVCFLDIEVFSPDEFPEAKYAKHPINLITIYDNISNKFFTWGTNPYTPTRPNVVYTECSSERDLLIKFLEFWENDYYPDILSGWNTDFFDFPYLINRIANILGEADTRRLSPLKSLWCRKGIFVKGQELDRWYIHGISAIDYLEVYKGFARGLLESYALNFVAQHELGEGKLAINATNLATLSETDWKNFVDYNIQDVDLLVRMENKLQFFKIIRMLAYKGLTNFESALGKVSIVTGCVALEARKHGMVIPTFVEGPTREAIEGGYVRDPERGLKTSIVSYDANSLYPNTIITLNISPETKVGKIVNKNNDSTTLLLTSGKEYKLPNTKFEKFVEMEKLAISKAGVLYTQKKKGVVPSLIDGLYNERVANKNQYVEYKKKLSKLTTDTDEHKDCKAKMERADTIQYVIKILLNSIYGVFANKFSPICDSDHAGSITLTGQSVVKQASVILDQYAKEKYGIDSSLTIYGDTDSTHVTIQPIVDKLKINLIQNGKITAEGLALIDKDMGTYLNTKIKEWSAVELKSVDPRYFFKRESICDVGVYLEKKRYIIHVLNDEGADINKFKYVGVEIARSTTPKKAKELIKKVIESSLILQDQIKANTLYKETYDTFKTFKVDDIAIRGGLSDLEKYDSKCEYPFKIAKGTPNHVKGAIYFNHLLKKMNLETKYEKITSGGKVKKIYVAPNRYQIDTLCYTGTYPTEFTDFQVDYVEMFDTLIKPPIEAVYEAIGWRLPDVINETETDLFSLFT
jgi:DNA polymerase elongation subunit (family B)